MALWYFLLKGRPYGPVTDEEIKKQIANGQMGAKDLLYREHDTSWREAQSFVDFQHLFAAPAAPQKTNTKAGSHGVPKKVTTSPSTDARWVLLARKLDGSGYRQKGPYTEEQVAHMLQVGEVTFTDYVWREGLKEWYKILAIPDFHKPFVETETVKRQLPPLPTEPDLSDNTQVDSDHEWAEITRNLPTPEDHAPPKVAAAAFPLQKSDPPPKKKTSVDKEVPVKKIVRRGSATKSKGTLETAKRTTFMQWASELRAVKKTTAILVILLLFISAAMVVILVSTYMDRRKLRIFNTAKYFISSNLGQSTAQKEPNRSRTADQQTSRTKVGTTKPGTADPVAASQAPVAAPAAILAEERIPPQYVRAIVEGSGGDGATVNIQTNASRHFPIKVTFLADGGDVLQFPSLEKSFRITKPEDRRVELKRLGLPPGTYQVMVEAGEFSDAATIALGTLGGDFRAQLIAYRKQLIYLHNEERYGFYKAATRLEKEAFRLAQTAASAGNLSSWTAFYKDWRRNFERIKSPTLDRISRKNRNEYVHARKWLELKKLRSEIDTEAKRLNRSRLKNQPIDVVVAKDLAIGVSKLKEAILQASLFKQ